MANHVVKKDMEFFYSEQFSFDLLIKEISSRFEYQTVCFVGFDRNFQSKVEDKKASFIPKFKLNLSDEENANEIACVVCRNDTQFNNCVNFCNKNSSNLILFIDNYFSLSMLNQNGKLNLLGVVVDKQNVEKNSKDFVLNFLFDITERIFNDVESKINNIYFGSEISEKNKKISEKIENFVKFLKKDCNFIDMDVVLDYYFEMITLCLNENESIVSFISSQTSSLQFSKLITSQIVLNLYLKFCLKFNPNLITYPVRNEDYEQFDQCVELNKWFDDKKFWFIHTRFKLSVINLIEQALKDIDEIKLLCNSINVEKMFELTNSCSFNYLKYALKSLTLTFKDCSFMKAICNYGLLNFDNLNKSRQI